MKMLLSIVIPVYNVEPYIARCLNSCIYQESVNPFNYEIIIVNDGSTDNSYAIAKQTLKHFTNVTYLDQENQGLSSARNNGLIKSKGQYIWFVDSDDWIEPNALKYIFPSLIENIDLIQLNHQLVYEDGMIKKTEEFKITGIISGKEQLLLRTLPAPAQFTIYRRQFLLDNNLRFVKGIYHEDSEFKPKALYLAQKVTSIPNVVYNYFQRSYGSITSVYKIKNAIDTLVVINNLYEFAQNVPIKCRRIFYNLICLNLNSIIKGMSQLNPKEKLQIKDEIKGKRQILKSIIHAQRMIYRIEGITLIYFPHIFYKIYNFIKSD